MLLCPLLLQFAEELRRAIPGIFGAHALRQMWAYSYDSRIRGIAVHADSAAVNVNFWITPESANLDPASGGLVVYRRRAPLDWGFHAYNRDTAAMRAYLAEREPDVVRIPYRQNRAVCFDSSLFHETAPYSFRDGYENRRINVTMLFGDRAPTTQL